MVRGMRQVFHTFAKITACTYQLTSMHLNRTVMGHSFSTQEQHALCSLPSSLVLLSAARSSFQDGSREFFQRNGQRQFTSCWHAAPPRVDPALSRTREMGHRYFPSSHREVEGPEHRQGRRCISLHSGVVGESSSLPCRRDRHEKSEHAAIGKSPKQIQR